MNNQIKRYALASFLVLWQFLANSQKDEFLIVLKVKGNIINITTGLALKANDKIDSRDQISFSSTSDVLILVSSVQGRITITPGDKANTKNEVEYFVREHMLPVEKFTSTRKNSQPSLATRQELNEFLVTNTLVIIDTFRLKIRSELFGLDIKPEFSLRFFQNNEIAEKLLLYDGNELLIPDLVCADDAELHQLMLLKKNSVQKIGDLRLVAPVKRELLHELQLLKNFAGSTEKEIRNELHRYISEIYGYIDPASFDQLLEKIL